MGASGPALHGGLGAALRGQCVGARLQDAGLASGPDAGAGGQSPQAPRAPRGSEAGVSGPRDGPGDVPATAPPHATRLHRPGLGPRRRFPDDLQTSICKGDPEILGFPHGCCGGEGCPQRWLVVVVFNLVFQTMGTLVSVDQQAKACLFRSENFEMVQKTLEKQPMAWHRMLSTAGRREATRGSLGYASDSAAISSRTVGRRSLWN